MSTDYTATILVGYEVPKSWMQEEVEVPGVGCKHTFSSQFCPVCGKAKAKPRKETRLREEALRVLGFKDEDAWWEKRGNYVKLGAFTFKEYGDCTGKKFFGVGVELVLSYEQKSADFHGSTPVPVLPTQEAVEAAMQEHGIPWKNGTFRLHILTEAW